jgi:hypothetical protein
MNREKKIDAILNTSIIILITVMLIMIATSFLAPILVRPDKTIFYFTNLLFIFFSLFALCSVVLVNLAVTNQLELTIPAILSMYKQQFRRFCNLFSVNSSGPFSLN